MSRSAPVNAQWPGRVNPGLACLHTDMLEPNQISSLDSKIFIQKMWAPSY